MSRKWMIVAVVAVCVPAAWWLSQRMGSRIVTVTPPGEGISQTLASERAANISSVRYTLALNVPSQKHEPVRGTVSVRLVLADRAPLIFDFAQPAEKVSSIQANGHAVSIRSDHGHLVIPAESLRQGENVVEIAFTAGDQALNRDDEFLY